jgi:hypothetical protein
MSLINFKKLLTYLSSVYGLLSSVSVFFPLSNYFYQAIEIYGDQKTFTYFSTLISIFIIFFLFSIRNLLNDFKKLSQIAALISFFIGLGAIYWYFEQYSFNLNIPSLYPGANPASESDFLLLYSSSFGAFTAAFTILGMIEYYRSNPQD